MPRRSLGALILIASLASLPFAAVAQSIVRITGQALGGKGFANFACLGAPTCTGTVTVHDENPVCSNHFTWTTNLLVTGLDLSHSGNLTGTMLVAQGQEHTMNSDGTCTYRLVPQQPYAMTGSWNAATGTGEIIATTNDMPPDIIDATFTATGIAPPPVFPMTVTGSITPTTTDINAQVQPRVEDVGSNGSIFVFAHAPSNLVHGTAPAKRDPGDHAAIHPADDAIVCVLAQVNSSGQLVAANASTMQAYLTGTLGAQAQAVQVLNNVPTPNVAGTTMYVGYGASAQAMLSNGIFQTAISAPAPKTPGPLTGLWWNPNEPGWGMHIAQRSNIVVVTWYTYDAAGNPKWYIASNCTGPSGSSGTCTGAVYEVNGPTFFGTNFTPITFADANNATLAFTVSGVTRTVAITRQVFPITPTAPPAVDYTDLWWNPNEAGWGMAITHQFGDIFLAWYVYDTSGKPSWYVASNCTVSGSSCSGTLYRTTSAPFGPTYDPSQFKVFSAGSAIVSFIDANDAVLSYTVDGVTATKTITRQIFP